jgi:hypothetical protein
MGTKKRAYGADAEMMLAVAVTAGQMPDGSGGDVFTKLAFKSTNLGEDVPLGQDPLLGQGADDQDPYDGASTDEGDLELPMDARQFGFVLKGLFGAPTSTGVKAVGAITFAANPSDADTITLNGKTWTFVSGTPSGNETQIQGTVTGTIDQLVTDLNASADVDIDDATYSRETGTQVLTITHDTADETGNAFAVAASGATASGTTLTGGGYDHVFTSGGDLPEFGGAIGHTGLTTPVWFGHVGIKMGGLSFGLARSGPANCKIPLIAMGETKLTAAPDASPKSYEVLRFSQRKGSVKLNGSSVAGLVGGDFNYSTNLDPVETIREDGWIDGVDETNRSASGSVTLRFSTDATVRDAVDAGEFVAMEYAYSEPSALRASVTFNMPRVKLPKKKGEINGPGGVEASYEWRASKDATAGHMLQVTLHNDVASYA